MATPPPSRMLRIALVAIICLAAGEFGEGAGLTYWQCSTAHLAATRLHCSFCPVLLPLIDIVHM